MIIYTWAKKLWKSMQPVNKNLIFWISKARRSFIYRQIKPNLNYKGTYLKFVKFVNIRNKIRSYFMLTNAKEGKSYKGSKIKRTDKSKNSAEIMSGKKIHLYSFILLVNLRKFAWFRPMSNVQTRQLHNKITRRVFATLF